MPKIATPGPTPIDFWADGMRVFHYLLWWIWGYVGYQYQSWTLQLLYHGRYEGCLHGFGVHFFFFPQLRPKSDSRTPRQNIHQLGFPQSKRLGSWLAKSYCLFMSFLSLSKCLVSWHPSDTTCIDISNAFRCCHEFEDFSGPFED